MKPLFFLTAVLLGMMSLLPAHAQVLMHRYSFNGNANDSVGSANGTVVGNVTFQTDPDVPSVNGSAVFGGGTSGSSPSYISLPTSAVSSLQNATVEMFTTNFNVPNDNYGTSGGFFQGLFVAATPYGNTTNYVVLSPNRAGTGLGTGSRSNNSAETVVVAHDPLPVWVGNHVVDLVYSGFTGIGSTGTETIYVDGKQVAQGQTVFSFADVAAGSGGISVVGIGGGSPFNDPTFSGSMDEVRIFNGALTPAQVTADVNAGPSQLGFTPTPVLAVSGVSTSAVTTTGATIGWTTNNTASDTVSYGLTSSYGSTVSGTGNATSHSVALTNLTPNTTYHYQVTSTDAFGQVATSPDATFTTAANPALILTSVTVFGITVSGATVTWTTSNPATDTVNYGLAASYGSTASGTGNTTSHSVTLSGLTPGTIYHYSVTSADVYGQTQSSPDATFSTTVPTLTLSNIAVSDLTTTGATVTWTTSNAASDTVAYGPTSAYGITASGAGNTINHSVILTGLQPGMTYHYQVASTDAYGQIQASTDATFTTAAPPPVTISAVAVSNITTTGATLTFTTSDAATVTVNYGTSNHYGMTFHAATASTSHTVTLSGLNSGTLYHFSVGASDGDSQTYSPDATFTTAATLGARLAVGAVSWTVGTNQLTATVTLHNVGAADATGVTLKWATLGTSRSISAMPLSVGTVAAGSTETVAVTFPAQSSGNSELLHLYGTYSGGSFTGSVRAIMP